MNNQQQYPVPFMDLLPLLHSVDVQALNGEQGSNRAPVDECQIKARNDYQAMYEWLEEYESSPHTHRQYQKEAERFLLWLLVERQKPLSSIVYDDIKAYRNFLLNPEPYARWCTDKYSRNIKRGSINWRPFTGPLSENSIKTAMHSLRSLFGYLESAYYLQRNPIKLLKSKVRQQETKEAKQLKVLERILPKAQWDEFLRTIDLMPTETQPQQKAKYRTKLIVEMMYGLSLRRSDLVQAKWLQFKQVNGKWWFDVIGKGKKHAPLPVSERLLTCIKQVRNFLQLSPLPNMNGQEDKFVVTSLYNSNKGINAQQVNRVLKNVAYETLARNLESIKLEDKERLKKFSSHWIRHIVGTHYSEAGIPLKARMQLMRHSHPNMTMLYDHLNDDVLHEAVNSNLL